MKTLKKILRALKMVILSMFGVDYQMEGVWFDNYFGWLEGLVEKLWQVKTPIEIVRALED